MALVKFIKTMDELVFEIPPSDKKQEISVFLTEKAGRNAVVQITADRSIQIKHYKQHRVGQ